MHASFQPPPALQAALLELVDRFAFGVIVTTAAGRVLAANRRADQLLAADGGLLQEPSLREAIRTSGSALADRTLTLTRGRSTLAISVVVLDERLAGVIVFDEPRAAYVEAALRRAYGLTPAEAALAGTLVRGASLSEAARARRISIHTARHQLRRVFEKTGTRRQSELMRLALWSPVSLLPDSGKPLVSHEEPK